MGMGGYGAPPYQAQQQQLSGGTSNGAAPGTDLFAGNKNSLAPKSDHLGAKKDSTFDFVGVRILHAAYCPWLRKVYHVCAVTV
jgi:hypothetical protein